MHSTDATTIQTLGQALHDLRVATRIYEMLCEGIPDDGGEGVSDVVLSGVSPHAVITAMVAISISARRFLADRGVSGLPAGPDTILGDAATTRDPQMVDAEAAADLMRALVGVASDQ